MSTHSFDIAMSARISNWYELLPQVESAMAAEDKIFQARTEAGWALDDRGWYAPDGTHETDWDAEFPEEKLLSH
jgi:hypothetical protein